MNETKSAKQWIYLLIGIVLIGLFVFLLAPALQRQSDTFEQISAFIDQHDVDTGAYVHTDSELADEAAFGVRSTMEYPPKGPKQSGKLTSK